MKKLSKIGQAAACVGIAFVGLTLAESIGKAPEPESLNQNLKQSVPLEVMELQAQDLITQVMEGGVVEAQDEVTLSAPLSGILKFVTKPLRPGMTFQKGDVLMAIDTARYESLLAQKQADLLAVNANLEALDQEKESLDEQLEILQSQEQTAHQEWERQKKLNYQQVASQSQVDQAFQEWASRRQQKRVLQEQRDRWPHRQQELLAQQAMRNTAVTLAEQDLDQSTLRFPWDGVLTDLNVGDQSWVSPGQALVELKSLDRLEVACPLSLEDQRLFAGREKELRCRLIQNGQAGDVIPLIFRDWGATIDRQSQERMLYLKWDASFPGKSLDLVPGQYLSFILELPSSEKVYVIPRLALRENDQVYLIENESLIKRSCQILRRQGDQVVIKDGLSDGELLVISPLESLPNGSKVRPIKRDIN